MTFHILRPGTLTTVQDLGRHGHQSEGVPVSGAMDHAALRIANLLVGNDDGAAALEITLTGPVIRFEDETLVALAGADLGAHLRVGFGARPGTSPDGQSLPPWRPILIPAGATIGFRGSRAGCRAYLAMSGGIAVPPVLGSRSTFARAGLGGYEGRALHGGDVLPCGPRSVLGDRIAATLRSAAQSAASQAHDSQAVERATIARWGAGPTLRPQYTSTPVVRLLPGAHQASLTQESREALYRSEFRVSPQSDRMGYRLEGAELRLAAPLELLSEAVAFGTLQLPPGGEPILLMVDRHTTGGYPRIGEVATADLPLLAQLRPGDSLRFRPITLEDAESLAHAREHDLAIARLAVALRHR